MLTLAILAVAVVSTSALPTPELQRNAYDEYDGFQQLTPESRSGGMKNEAMRDANEASIQTTDLYHYPILMSYVGLFWTELGVTHSLLADAVQVWTCSGGNDNGGLADELPEWSGRPDIIPLSTRLIDRLGDNRLVYRSYDDGDIDMRKRRVDSLGGNNLVRRSLDRLGGNHLVKKALDRLGGGHLVRRALDTLGGYSLVKRRLDSLGGNSLVKRMLDSLGGNSLVKRTLDSLGGNSLVKRRVDTLGGNSLVRRSLDTLGGNSLVKRRLDTLGGNSLVKRTLDSLGGNSLVKRRLDTLGGNRLVRRSLDTIGGQNLIKRSREGNSKAFVDKLGGGHLLKRSPEAPESLDNRGQDSETDSTYESTDSYSDVEVLKDVSEPTYVLPWRHPLDTLGGSHLLRDSRLSDAEALELLQFYGKISG